MNDPHTKGMIVLRNAAPGYPGESPVLAGINLTAFPGEIVALVGRNGSGKSTLLRSVAGILPLKKGVCEIGGHPLPAYDIRKRARMISLVSSRIPAMPAMTVGELVSLGRIPYTGWTGRYSREDMQMIAEAIEKLGLQEIAARRVDQVSDGERQRALIARAFVQDTPVMLLDEPTAFLDMPARFGLAGVLEEFRDSGKTLIYATHDLEMALMHADRLWVIDRKRVLEGGPEDLGLSGLFDTLFREENITFDHAGFRFTRNTRWRGTCVISGGDDLVRHWTRSALQRAGFRTGEGTGSPLPGDAPPGEGSFMQVTIGGSGKETRWRLHRGESDFSFDRIYTLVQFLTREK